MFSDRTMELSLSPTKEFLLKKTQLAQVTFHFGDTMCTTQDYTSCVEAWLQNFPAPKTIAD